MQSAIGMERRVRPKRPQQVLIVDDSKEIQSMWAAWLTFWGFEVKHAMNGAEGVVNALADPPDLILMDLSMPVLDGLSAMAHLRADPTTAHIPILALSGRTDSTPARQAGADDYLMKPVDPDQLLEHMRTALARLPGAAGGGSGSGS